jgi:hypothetical protein
VNGSAGVVKGVLDVAIYISTILKQKKESRLYS